jgi:hypothetical protein
MDLFKQVLLFKEPKIGILRAIDRKNQPFKQALSGCCFLTEVIRQL